MDLFTRKDGTSIHYSTLGEGYPIVLIHTVLDNYSVFNKLAAELAKSFQVVLIDLRGHGYSDKPRHIEIKDFSDDIVELLKYYTLKKLHLYAMKWVESLVRIFQYVILNLHHHLCW
ncbi:3-oxoadipate enol-lactonase [Staphylococcus aureus]|uniref:3-oxoadipate enol-lactonase n=1 Tax=Staphylococcus aureus TaxID=1280 RepID=A0A380DM72_STAAU|nr:3-oxoadipate enol-lactonase [Staphylococcus aureus]